MLTIRAEQMRVFQNAGLKRFEEKMLLHLGRFWPSRCDALGEAAVRRSIYDAVEIARSYGIVIEYDVARYLDLMYAYTFDFDKSPETAWAGEILSEPHLTPTI